MTADLQFAHRHELEDAATDPAIQLREDGIALLRGCFSSKRIKVIKAIEPIGALTRLREAAVRCFQTVEKQGDLPEHWRFNRFSNSVLLTALLDFGCDDTRELLGPLSAPGVERLLSDAVGGDWICGLEQSWVRKKYAPVHTPTAGYHPQDWHQDGALGVRFPAESGLAMADVPMTELAACWIPLDDCGRDSPGLEFVRGRQPGLLHYTELDDAALRRRFPAEAFWALEMELGDGLIFRNSVLHRTYTRPEMLRDRLSVEYRVFRR